MKRRLEKLSMLALLGALSITSCRNIEPEVSVTEIDQGIGGVPVEGRVNVQVNLLGTSFSSVKGTYGASLPEPQTFVKELSPGNSIVAELAPTVSPFSDIVKGDNLPKDYPYRVFVFDQEARTLVDYKDFRVGEEKPASFTLDFEGNYILIAYTDSSGKLPEFTGFQSKKMDDINIDFSGSDVMYFKMENYSPSKIGNVVNITLMHKTSTITLNVKRMLYKEYVKDVVISQNNNSGTINIGTGNIVSRAKPVEQNIDKNLTFDLPEGNVVSSLIPLNIADNFKLMLKIKQDNEFKNIELPFKVDLGTKYTLTLKKKYQCGAYVSKELWKEFMCHNLGANYDAHPINTIKELYGNKYVWGVKEPVSTNEDDVKGASKPFPAHSPAITSWQDDFKTENDPCPSGYRVPTSGYIEGLIKYNNYELLKTWSEDKEYLAKFGNDLIFPLSGYRVHNGRFIRVNNSGYYWSSYSNEKGTLGYRLGFGKDLPNFEYIKIPEDTNIYAIPVRCIKEDGKVTVRPDIPKVGTGWDKEKDIEVDIDEIIKKNKASKNNR